MQYFLNINEVFYILFLVPSVQNVVRLLHSPHILYCDSD